MIKLKKAMIGLNRHGAQQVFSNGKRQYYIASKLESAGKVQEIMGALKSKSTFDWTLSAPAHTKGKGAMEDTSWCEILGASLCDLFILVCPGGRGAHAELGAALSRGAKVMIYSKRKDDFIEGKNASSFYFHRNVILRTDNIGDLIEKANIFLETGLCL